MQWGKDNLFNKWFGETGYSHVRMKLKLVKNSNKNESKRNLQECYCFKNSYVYITLFCTDNEKICMEICTLVLA